MPSISQIALYVRDMPKVAAFYKEYFGFHATSEAIDKIRLSSFDGCDIVLLQASKGHKIGQSVVKIIFDVEDIEGFKKKCADKGLIFGKTHSGVGYQFSNARDPAKNLIQISNSHFSRTKKSA
jgi:predicted enzyme related to lactoylglutathione lyase